MSELARKRPFGEWMTIVNTVIAVLGFVVVIYQLHLGRSELEGARRSEQAQYIAQLHERAFGTPGIRDVFRQVEYGDLKYDADFHKSVEQENLLVLLSFFELAGQLESLGAVDMGDVRLIFGYYLCRTYKNQAVRDYVDLLRRTGRLGFHQFERLAHETLTDDDPDSASCSGASGG